MKSLKELIESIRELSTQIEQSLDAGDTLSVQEIATMEKLRTVLGTARDIQIHNLHKRGYRNKVIAEHFLISEGRVSQILKKTLPQVEVDID